MKDKNLCKISKFVIKLKNGTKVDLQYGDDHSELIAELLEKHKSLTFEFEDAHGVTTLVKSAPGYGIFYLAFDLFEPNIV